MILQAGLKYKCVTSTRKSTTCILLMKQLHGHTHGLAKKKYNLVFNNCEHFAVWCKTGISDSEQVTKAIATAAVISVGIIVLGVLNWLKNDDTIDV